ncbi:MAG: hypothetical protein QM714_02230 [Nocardioides sp.]|uniref:hypothetical protein n=1 Tax=Nocardioides sp. TaxID=35761 RepID=UPI0039E4864A
MRCSPLEGVEGEDRWHQSTQIATGERIAATFTLDHGAPGTMSAGRLRAALGL